MPPGEEKDKAVKQAHKDLESLKKIQLHEDESASETKQTPETPAANTETPATSDPTPAAPVQP